MPAPKKWRPDHDGPRAGPAAATPRRHRRQAAPKPASGLPSFLPAGRTRISLSVSGTSEPSSVEPEADLGLHLQHHLRQRLAQLGVELQVIEPAANLGVAMRTKSSFERPAASMPTATARRNEVRDTALALATPLVGAGGRRIAGSGGRRARVLRGRRHRQNLITLAARRDSGLVLGPRPAWAPTRSGTIARGRDRGRDRVSTMGYPRGVPGAPEKTEELSSKTWCRRPAACPRIRRLCGQQLRSAPRHG